MKWLTWDVLTNAVYLLVAILVAHSDGPTGYVFIATMAFLTVGSAGYHAGLPKWNHLDVMGTYVVGLYLWLVVIHLASGWWVSLVSAAGLAVGGAYLLRMKQLDVRMEVKVGALFGVLYATAFMFYGAEWETLIISVSFMVAGLLVRGGNHALWHVLSAIGLGLLWSGVS